MIEIRVVFWRGHSADRFELSALVPIRSTIRCSTTLSFFNR